jgi:CheY-like chemotaxis protein
MPSFRNTEYAIMHNEAIVIVLDDHDSVRHSLRVLLESGGFTVRDYPSAVGYLDSGMEADCIVSDMRMPHMSGLELQGELVRRKSASPLILITGHGDVKLAVAAMRGGAFDFLEKPLDDDRFAGQRGPRAQAGQQGPPLGPGKQGSGPFDRRSHRPRARSAGPAGLGALQQAGGA